MACLTKPNVNSLPSDLETYLQNNKTAYNAAVQQSCLGVALQSDGSFRELGLDEWLNNWNQGVCPNFPDSTNYQTQISMMNYVVSKYYSSQTFSTGKYGIPTAENNILNVCSAYPGACGTVQESMCRTCNETQISNSYGLIRLCGCYAPPSGISNSNSVTPQCQSLCSNSTAIKLANKAGRQLECNEAVCVIDNVSIQSSQTTFNNSSISQVCSNCRDGCKCFLDVSINNLAQVINVKDNDNLFTTYCPDSTCFQLQGGKTTQVSCNNFNNSLNPELVYTWNRPFVIGCIIFIVLAIIVILSMYLWGFNFEIRKFDLWKPTAKNPLMSSKAYFRH